MRRHFSALLVLATLSRAWRAEFSDATQCGTVTVTWSGATAESIGPPFVVRVAPFGLAPLTFNLSETAASAWNAASRTGSYSFTAPWPAGTRFISVMDDGFGLGTGGVSGIQTVKSSSNSTCIDSSVTEPRRMFDINSSFAQCSQVSMNWTEPATSQTRITGLVPNGVAFQLDPPRTASRSTSWDLNIESGTAFVLIYNDGSGNGMTSPLLQSLDSSIRTCLASGAYPSATASQTGVEQATATESPIPATSALPTATSTPESANSDSRSNLGPILGAVLGTLALLGALGVGVWILRRRRKRVVPQTAEFGAKVDLDTQNTQPGHQFYGNHSSTSPQHPGGPAILPFVLPYNGTYQQENSQSNHSRKRPLRDTPADIADVSDSSHDYTTGTSVSQSAPPPREDEEPMIIQHEDAGALVPPRPREVIELPPGYDQLPRPPPPAQAPQQARPRPLPQPK